MDDFELGTRVEQKFRVPHHDFGVPDRAGEQVMRFCQGSYGLSFRNFRNASEPSIYGLQLL